MACDVEYLLHRAETEAVRAIACDSAGVAAVHQEMCLLYTGQAIAGLLRWASAAARGAGTSSRRPDDPAGGGCPVLRRRRPSAPAGAGPR